MIVAVKTPTKNKVLKSMKRSKKLQMSKEDSEKEEEAVLDLVQDAEEVSIDLFGLQ